MMDENGVWQIVVAPDGQEQVTVGTPEFPVEVWGTRDQTRALPDLYVPWHWHPEFEIDLIAEGEEQTTVDGRTFRLHTGQGVFVNSGVPHMSQKAPEAEMVRHISLLFHPAVVGGASGSVFWQKYLSPLIGAPECRCILLPGETQWQRQLLTGVEQVVRLWQQKQPGYEFEVRAELSRILFLLKEHCVEHAQPPTAQELRDAERIKQMMDFVRAHRQEEITTAQIAASAAISVSECLRCFRRMLDLTPKEYLQQHRLRHAVSLLEQTEKSISCIGAECGFTDMSYFARVFRAHYGCTPSQYRTRNAK